MVNIAKLITVFVEVRKRLSEREFVYSSWQNARAAVAEIDGILETLKAGGVPVRQASTLFAPTGPIQEASLDGGWGDEYLTLADRFDEAMDEGEGS